MKRNSEKLRKKSLWQNDYRFIDHLVIDIGTSDNGFTIFLFYYKISILYCDRIIAEAYLKMKYYSENIELLPISTSLFKLLMQYFQIYILKNCVL